MLSLGIKKFSGSADADQEYLWPIYWCAVDKATLDMNVKNISTIFTVNGEKVPDEFVFDFNLDTDTGWKCNYRASVIGDLPKNTSLQLQVIRILETEIFDGQVTYPQGNYTYEVIITVK
jgi:hypothetical protein